MKFSFNRVWDDLALIVRKQLPLLLAIAGVFIFLPNLLLGHLLPAPTLTGTDQKVITEALVEYFSATWYWYVAALVVDMAGILAISILILDEYRPTVGTAISRAMPLLPTYLVGQLLIGLGMAIVVIFLTGLLGVVTGNQTTGLMVALIPCLYLYARLSIFGQVLVAEDRRGPVNLLKRSFALTKGHAWGIAGLIVGAFLLRGFVSLAVQGVFGSLFLILLPKPLATFLELILATGVATVIETLVIAMLAAIYRTLLPVVPRPSLVN